MKHKLPAMKFVPIFIMKLQRLEDEILKLSVEKNNVLSEYEKKYCVDSGIYSNGRVKRA